MRPYGRFQTGWKISGNTGRFQDTLGSLLLKHMKPERKATQTAFTGEMHLDWNGPVVSTAEYLIRASMDRWFGSRGRSISTGTSKIYTSDVVIRKKSEVSRLSFLNKTFICEIYCSIHCLRHLNHTCHPQRQKVT